MKLGMGKGRNSIIISGVIIAFVAGTLIFNSNFAEAVGGWRLFFEGLEERVTDLENKPITISKLARGGDYVDEDFERGIILIDLHSSVAGAISVLDNNGEKTSGFNIIFRDVGQAQTMISYKFEVFDGNSDFEKFLEPHDIQTVLYVDGNPTTMQCLIPFGQSECIATGNISIQNDQGWAIGYFVTDDLNLDPNGPNLNGPSILASYTVEITQ